MKNEKKKLRHGRDSIPVFLKIEIFLHLMVYLVEDVARKSPRRKTRIEARKCTINLLDDFS